MKVITAQNLTRNSPVASIKDLAVWYETSLDESFDNAEETEDSPITNWFDLNPQSSYKINGLQANLANKPKFKTNIFNGLPGIFFDGIDDHIIVNSAGISGRGLSIFIVAQRKNFGTFQGLLSGINSATTTDEAGSAGAFQAFFDNGVLYNTISTSIWYSAVSQTSPKDNVPFIASTFFNATNNTSYLNTNTGTTVAGSPSFNVDRLYIASRFTNGPSFYFWGHIAEIIIFNRGLNTEERLAVTSYLSKKYAIKVS
jgi:hypothetical protein